MEIVKIPALVTTKQAAGQLGVSEQRVRTLLRSGELAGQQVAGTWLISPQNLGQKLKELSPADRHVNTPVAGSDKLRALSFFTGAMGLDLGLERAGIEVILACEIDKHCRQTITLNRPTLPLLGDIWKYSASEIRVAAGLTEVEEIDLVVGGPPCQAFSTAGSRKGFNDERGNALLRYLDLILELRPRYAVLENVRGLLSAPLSHRPHAERSDDAELRVEESAGGALLEVITRLRAGGYGVSFNLYNAANFGVPQVRERVVMVCHRGGMVLPHLQPTHSQDPAFELPPWRTLHDAIADLHGHKHHHLNFPANRLRFYELLKAGQYWKHLPDSLQREALGNSYFSGGGKTGFYRRLDWNKPSCTVVTHPAMPATDICHPVENRPLSIEEYKRIQQFPDDWQLAGKLLDQYKQIGNAVPIGLGEAVGRLIMAHMQEQEIVSYQQFPYSRYRQTDEVSWERQTRAALALANKTNVAKSDKQKPQIELAF